MQSELDRESAALQELESQKQDAQDRLQEMDQQKLKLEDMLNEIRMKCQEESQMVKRRGPGVGGWGGGASISVETHPVNTAPEAEDLLLSLLTCACRSPPSRARSTARNRTCKARRRS